MDWEALGVVRGCTCTDSVGGGQCAGEAGWAALAEDLGGSELFLLRPAEAVHLWAESGQLGTTSPCAVALARKLRATRSIPRVKVGEFLASDDQNVLLKALIREFDVRGVDLVLALAVIGRELGLLPPKRRVRKRKLPSGSPGSFLRRDSMFSSSAASRFASDWSSTGYESSAWSHFEDDDDPTSEKVRKISEEIARWYWSVNVDLVHGIFFDQDVIAMLLVELINLNERVLKNKKRTGRRWFHESVRAFTERCQYLASVQNGVALEVSVCEKLFHQIVSEPLVASENEDEVLFWQEERQRDEVEFDVKEMEGYVWFRHPKHFRQTIRIWCVLSDWTLYGFDGPDAQTTEGRSLMCIIPLKDAKPSVQPRSIHLDGLLKIAFTENWFRRNECIMMVKKSSWRNLLSPKRNRSSNAAVPRQLLTVDFLEIICQTKSDALRWFNAFQSNATSPQGSASASFSETIDRLRPDGWSFGMKPGTKEGMTEGSLLICEFSCEDERRSPNDVHIENFQPRLISLFGRTMVIQSDEKKTNRKSVLDLKDLRMVLPFRNRWIRDHNLFAFELVHRELRTICICATPALKDYTIWFKAFTALTEMENDEHLLEGLENVQHETKHEEGEEEGEEEEEEDDDDEDDVDHRQKEINFVATSAADIANHYSQLLSKAKRLLEQDFTTEDESTIDEIPISP